MSASVVTLKSVSKVFKRYSHPASRLREIFFPGTSQADNFWALRDISLDILQGETVGVIGRNGSGKSTLLQIIAGTLQPTQGDVQVAGRVSALLELGSGFNPEFTGRQNVFFNGQVLGLSRAEIEERFDAIVAFSDLERFIDQPVKTYSSGMFVRLAFAVAIHVDPEILVIDEALAVGDEAFQRKCFAKIHALREQGVSIIFVSHSATSIVELCDRALWLEQGQLLLAGEPKSTVEQYQRFIYASPQRQATLLQTYRQQRGDSSCPPLFNPDADERITRLRRDLSASAEAIKQGFYDPELETGQTLHYSSNGAVIQHPQLLTPAGERVNLLLRNERYLYTYTVHFLEDCFRVKFGMLIKTVSGFELGGAASHAPGMEVPYVAAGTELTLQFEFRCHLLPGAYFINAGLMGTVEGAETFLDRRIDAVMFKVLNNAHTPLYATGIVDFEITPTILHPTAPTASDSTS